jgi:outer membrane protein assembly factor BamA
MGGTDSMRGWLLSSFVPQDDIDRIRADFNKPDCVRGQPCDKFTLGTQPVRGGNLMVNPKVELRVPLPWRPFETALFVDAGNLWRRATYPIDNGKFPLRASVGAGLRAQTPVGPIALDYGVNVTRDRTYANEDFGAFHFGIGLF